MRILKRIRGLLNVFLFILHQIKLLFKRFLYKATFEKEFPLNKCKCMCLTVEKPKACEGRNSSQTSKFLAQTSTSQSLVINYIPRFFRVHTNVTFKK